MNHKLKIMAAAAISVALALPGFVALAQSETGISNSSQARSASSSENGQKKTECREKYKSDLKTARELRKGALEKIRNDYKTAVLSAKQKLEADLKLAGEDKAARQAAKQTYKTTVKSLRETRKTSIKAANDVYKTSRESVRKALKDCLKPTQ